MTIRIRPNAYFLTFNPFFFLASFVETLPATSDCENNANSDCENNASVARFQRRCRQRLYLQVRASKVYLHIVNDRWFRMKRSGMRNLNCYYVIYFLLLSAKNKCSLLRNF
jgi:hypothetical protein